MQLDYIHRRIMAGLIVAVCCTTVGISILQARTPGRGYQTLLGDRASAATIIYHPEDTLRIFDQYAGVGDTFVLNIQVANVETVGAYAICIVYDPSLIEPLTDSVFGTEQSYYFLELEQLRGGAFEEFSGTVNFPGLLTMLAADYDLNPQEAFGPGAGISCRMLWRVHNGVAPTSTPLSFEILAQSPESFNALTDFYGDSLYRPTLTNGVVHILAQSCDCSFQGDLDANGQFDSVDLNLLVDALFFNGPSPQDGSCPFPRADWNADGQIDAIDLNQMVGGIFFNSDFPINPCSGTGP